MIKNLVRSSPHATKAAKEVAGDLYPAPCSQTIRNCEKRLKYSRKISICVAMQQDFIEVGHFLDMAKVFDPFDSTS